jgi:hypothetical protein
MFTGRNPLGLAGIALSLAVVASAGAGDDLREFKLANGDILRGRVVEVKGKEVVVQHPVLGTITLPLSSLVPLPGTGAAADAAKAEAEARRAQLGPEAAPPTDKSVPPLLRAPAPQKTLEEDDVRTIDSPAGAALMDAPVAMKPTIDPVLQAVPLPAAPPSPWKFIFDANANYVQSSDKQLDIRLALAAIYEKKDIDRWKTDVEYFFKTVNSNETDNNLLITTVYDHYFGKDSKWLWFVKGQGQYAPLENWEERLSGWAGIGYKFVDDGKFKLTGKIGAGASYEFGGSDFSPQLYGEVEGSWKISATQTLVGSAWIAPDLSNFGEFTSLCRLEWQLKIDPPSSLSFLGGVRWEYQSSVPVGDTYNDIRVYLGLRYEI